MRSPWRHRRIIGASIGVALAPLAVGIAVIVLASRGPSALSWSIVALAIAALGGSIALAIRTHRGIALGAIAPNLVLALGLSTYCGSPLPEPAPLAGDLPTASPPSTMAVFALPTGVTHRTAAFAYRGGSIFEARDFAMGAVLVKHPRGDLLIDTGLGKDIDAQLATMPRYFRLMTDYDRGRSTAEQLAAAGYDRTALRAVLLTHAHWDHVSGLPELAGTPVWVTAAEHRFIDEGGAIMALTRSLIGVAYVEYGFEGGPYLGFPQSHDVYGDGAIVVVPAPGHTPGSVIVFLALPTGRRYALIGDLVWQLEGITLREERPWMTRRFADDDPDGVRDAIGKVAAIAARFPTLVIVPAHDTRGYETMPRL